MGAALAPGDRRSTMRITRRLLVPLLSVGLALGWAPAPAAAEPTGADAAVLRGIDLDRATVLDLQRAMRAGRLTSTGLTRFYLARIERLDPKLHAVLEINPDALRAAAASDRHRRRHGARSALEGIPVLLK